MLDSRKLDEFVVLILLIELRAPGDHALHPYAHGFRSEGFNWDQPRRAWHDLRRRQYALQHETLCGSHADAEPLRCLHQADYLAISFRRIVVRDAETFAHLAHTDRRPGLTVAGLATHPVERDGELTIRPVSGKFADNVDGSRRYVAFRLPTILHPLATANSMLIRRDKPLQMTVLPGGLSLALAR